MRVASLRNNGVGPLCGLLGKSLEALTEDGALCFICSDRWLQNRYGSRLRAFVSKRYSLDVHVRMHGVSAFEDDVSAYPAISLIRRGTGRPIRYMECRPRFSLSDVSAAKSWIASGEGTYRSENASADVLRPLSGSGSIPLAAPEKLQLLGDLANRYPRLEDAGVKLGIGVASGCDEVYITEDPDLVEKDRMLPLFFMRDWFTMAGPGRLRLVADGHCAIVRFDYLEALGRIQVVLIGLIDDAVPVLFDGYYLVVLAIDEPDRRRLAVILNNH